MKAHKIIIITGLVFIFLGLSSFATISKKLAPTLEFQDEMTVVAAYDGKEDYGYNFVAKNKDGDENTLTFQKVEEDVLKTFDLNSETLIGSKFKVSYTTKVEITKDADGYEDENEINTISKLEKL